MVATNTKELGLALTIRSGPLVHQEEHDHDPGDAEQEGAAADGEGARVQLFGVVDEAVVEFGVGLEGEAEGDEAGGKEEEEGEGAGPAVVAEAARLVRVVLVAARDCVHGGGAGGVRGRCAQRVR